MTSIAPEVIESLDSFEAIADAARMVSTDMDGGRWTLGDLANQCARRWGENTIGDLAAEIRIAKAQTLRDYARVARRFPFAVRNAFEDAPLTFSHFRTACAAGDDAELWLARAADEGWAVAALAREIKAATGKPVPPEKLVEFSGIVIWHDEMRVTFHADAPFTGLDGRQRVTVKVYALTQEAV